MATNFLKGMKGLHETAAFIAAFPLSIDPNMETVLTVQAFDTWADGNGYYTTNCEQATLLESRNRLKKKLNSTASSPAWLAQGNKPFFIAVRDHGVSLAVQRVEDAFSVKAVQLPRQVKQYAGTKRVAIQALLGSIDRLALAPAWQMRIAAFDREIDRYLRSIDYQTMELDREYNAIRAQLKQMVDNHLLPGNGENEKLLGFFDAATDGTDNGTPAD